MFSLKNHTQNVVEKLFPGSFLKNQNWAYLWINSLKFSSFRNILKVSCRPLDFTSYKALLKNKKISGTSLPASFLYEFWKKIFISLYSGGAVVKWVSLLHNFIQLSLNSGSAQVQILLATCRRFVMVRIFNNGPGWKQG